MANLATHTARSSVRLIRQALSDLRAASANLSDDANIQEIARSADVLSGAIKRLAAYVGDVPTEAEPPRQRENIDIKQVNRILEAAQASTRCPKCGCLQP